VTAVGFNPFRTRASREGRPGPVRAAAIAVAGAWLVLATSAPAMADTAPARSEVAVVPAKPHPRRATLMKRRWGIEIVGIRPAAAGYMLEFRYKVLDPDKAAPLFKRQTKPVLVDERTGARMAVPTPAKTGALRTSDPPRANHVYWMFFANPGRMIQPGQRVTVEIGGFRAENLVVE
jgi:hypothetical protein